MKLVIWGTGGHWEKLKKICDFEADEIVLFVDNNPREDYMILNNKKIAVERPSAIFEHVYDYIIIASTYVEEIKSQLNDMGIAAEKIIDDITGTKMGRSFLDEKKMIFSIMEDIGITKRLANFEEKTDLILIQNGRIWSSLLRKSTPSVLHEVGFKVFSQWDEDGIIQWLISQVPIKNKTFIEFGVENYTEANTRFLLINDNWSGMIIDGSEKNIAQIKKSSLMWKYDLKAVTAFITKDNINDLLLQSGFDQDLGLLSVDIDGNDYWILKEIEVMHPRILIVEYNHIFGGRKTVTIPYQSDFVRTTTHYSNLYFGMSFQAAKRLAEEKGYVYVGSNSQYNNAFFIRKDLVGYIDISKLDLEWKASRFRESRNQSGKLSYLSREEGLYLIKDLEVFDLDRGKNVMIKEEFEL